MGIRRASSRSFLAVFASGRLPARAILGQKSEKRPTYSPSDGILRSIRSEIRPSPPPKTAKATLGMPFPQKGTLAADETAGFVRNSQASP
jgi:hypothetical protein